MHALRPSLEDETLWTSTSYTGHMRTFAHTTISDAAMFVRKQSKFTIILIMHRSVTSIDR